MSDVDEIKSRLNIVDVIGERVTLKKLGRNFKGLCPFHSEKSPSFIVSPDRQIFKCFGCGKGGSVIDFVMEWAHVDFVEALEELAAKAGVTLTRRTPDTAEGKLKKRIFEANHLASEYYHFLLTKHEHGEKARLYLKNRGISDKSIHTFVLGYSPNSWDGLLRFLQKKGYDAKLLEIAGLVISGSRGHYDRFRGRVMFTLKDHRGQVVGFAGRTLVEEEKNSSGQAGPPAQAGAKYINTSETPVYIKSNVLYGLDVTKDAIAKANEAVVMEGELDVISSFQAGISNVVAIKGSALTEGHVRLLRRFTERLAFALDSDVAGDAAARRGIEIADRAGFDMRVVRLPSGKDPDEAARQSPGLLKKAIKEAIPIYDYLLDSALTRFSADSAFGKKKISEEMFPVLSEIENTIVRAHYIKKLARALDVTEETIGEGIDSLKKKLPQTRTQEKSVDPAIRTRPEKLEVYILALMLQGETAALFGELEGHVDDNFFEQPSVKQILTRVGTYIKASKTFDIKEFAKNLPVELLPTFDEAYLWDMADMVEDKVKMTREWAVAIRELRRLQLKRSIAVLSSKGDQKEYQDKLNRLTTELRSLEKEANI